MRVDYQWATDPASDWLSIDSRDWSTLAKRPERTDGTVLAPGDAVPGYVNQLNVMGNVLSADHLAVVHNDVAGFVELHQWNDDPGDFTPRERWAQVRRVYPQWLDRVRYNWPDGSGHTTVTGFRQERTVYVHNSKIASQPFAIDTGGVVIVLDYDSYTPPADARIRHGIQQTDEVFAESKTFAAAENDEWIGEIL